MPLVVFIMLLRGVVHGALHAFRDKPREVKGEPLCAECSHAHMQYGANARRAISCTFGGAVRPVKLDVLYCTDYQPRNRPVRSRPIGFVREIAAAD
jgi:hypothetical protein